MQIAGAAAGYTQRGPQTAKAERVQEERARAASAAAAVVVVVVVMTMKREAGLAAAGFEPQSTQRLAGRAAVAPGGARGSRLGGSLIREMQDRQRAIARNGDDELLLGRLGARIGRRGLRLALRGPRLSVAE
jgi:hypothetical protein